MNRRKFATGLSLLAAALLPKRVSADSTSGSGANGQEGNKQVYGVGKDKSQAGVYGVNFHGGNGVDGQTDSGNGVMGEANNGAGVSGVSQTGIGVNGKSDKGVGVFGTGKTGVAAVGGGPSTIALWISNGAIKVAGAGPGTNTAVFVHVKTASNSFYYNDNHDVGGFTIIDNPYANGDPNAILFITRDATGYGLNEPIVTVQYFDSHQFPPQARNHWIISFGNVDLHDGAKLNVMIIKP